MLASNVLKMKGWAVKEVIYGCIRGLDGRTPGCKLGMHTKCFDKIQKSMILDPCRGQNGGSKDSEAVAITALEICVLYRWCMVEDEKILPLKRHW